MTLGIVYNTTPVSLLCLHLNSENNEATFPAKTMNFVFASLHFTVMEKFEDGSDGQIVTWLLIQNRKTAPSSIKSDIDLEFA